MLKGLSYRILLVLFFAGTAVLMGRQMAHAAWQYHAGLLFYPEFQASVYSGNTGLTIGGLVAAQKQVPGNIGYWTAETYAYARFISGKDIYGNVLPWVPSAQATDILDVADVFLTAYIEEGTGPFTIEAWHISDDSWNGNALTWANQPLLSGAMATLLDSKEVSHIGHTGAYAITWNLLESGAYQNIWKEQDFKDGAISILFRISASDSDMGKVILYQKGSYSISLAGSPEPPANSVPEPATLLLLSLGGLGLAGIRKIQKS